MERKSGSVNVFFILFIMAFIIITAVTVEFYHIFTVKEYIDTELSRALNIATDYAMLDEYRMEHINRSNSEVYNLLQAVNPDAFDKFQDLKYNDKEKWSFVKLDYSRRTDLAEHPEKALPNAKNVTADSRKFTELFIRRK